MAPITFNDVPADCINQAATIYHIPATLILSLLKIENGHNGMAKKNPDGSYDYGPLQINSWWLPTLKRYSITREQIQFNPCVNVLVGTWILAQAITETKYLPQGIGNYNSHTPSYNQRYSQQVLTWYRFFEKKMN